MNRVKEFRKELGISISPAASKLTSTVSFGRKIFKKGANL